MRYTPGQLREAVGLSKEMFRHWRRVLPGFPRGQNHAPSFLPGGVLAIAVLPRLTASLRGVRVGQLRAVSRSVFVVCNETLWEVLARRMMVVDLDRLGCATVRRTDPIGPMVPVVTGCREALAGSSTRVAGVPGRGDSAPAVVERRA